MLFCYLFVVIKQMTSVHYFPMIQNKVKKKYDTKIKNWYHLYFIFLIVLKRGNNYKLLD